MPVTSRSGDAYCGRHGRPHDGKQPASSAWPCIRRRRGACDSCFLFASPHTHTRSHPLSLTGVFLATDVFATATFTSRASKSLSRRTLRPRRVRGVHVSSLPDSYSERKWRISLYSARRPSLSDAVCNSHSYLRGLDRYRGEWPSLTDGFRHPPLVSRNISNHVWR